MVENHPTERPTDGLPTIEAKALETAKAAIRETFAKAPSLPSLRPA